MAYSWVESNWNVISCGLLSREQSERDQPWLTHAVMDGEQLEHDQLWVTE